MSRILFELKTLLGIGGLVSIYGAASILVLYLGPQYGYGRTHQLVVIGLLLLTAPLALAVRAFRRRRRERRREAAAEMKDGEPEPKDARPAPDEDEPAPPRTYEDLTRGAEEAVHWLRQTRLGGASGAADAVYALPWFLVAGPLDSGKTSFVLSSNRDFKRLPNKGVGDHRLVQQTRGCEWRFTDSALFLDTAGRYQQKGAGDVWAALAAVLKKHRALRPLDGYVLAVSAEWLMGASHDKIDDEATAMRTRLDEMMQLTGVRFPVYLVLTHADKIPGFTQFFALADRATRDAVWGTTFKLEDAPRVNALFDGEYDALHTTLLSQRVARLKASGDPGEHLRVFEFPERFNEMRGALGIFTQTLFRPDLAKPLDPLPRGIYFTANVGEEQRGGAGDEEIGPRLALRTLGEDFFTVRLFRDVLLRDKDVAASLHPTPRRAYRFRVAQLASAAALALGFVAWLGASYFGNRALIAEALRRGAAVEERVRLNGGREPGALDPSEAARDIAALERLRQMVDTLDEHERDGPPLRLRWLYAGDKLNPQLRAIYFDALTQRYFKPVLVAVENDLRAFASNATAAPQAAEGQPPNDEERLSRRYDLFKAYLMLTTGPRRVEPEFLAAQLANYWRAASPPDMQSVSQQQLNFYARQAARPDAPRAKADEALVRGARSRLAAYPAVVRYYRRVVNEVNGRAREVTLASILGGRGGGVLTGSYAVPGSYTIEGFREHISPAFKEAAAEIGKDNWVTSAAQPESGASADDVSKLWSLYFRDYTDHWRSFLRATDVVRFNTKQDAVTGLTALTATDSPMELVMESVARHTNLSALAETGYIARFVSYVSGNRPHDTGGNSEVENEFKPLMDFVSKTKEKEAGGVSQYRAALQQVLGPLERSSPDQLSQTAQVLLTQGDDALGLQKSDQAVTRLLDGFRTAAGRDAADLLKQPLGNLRASLYGSGYEQVAREWRDQIYPLAKRIEESYPFTDVGRSSVGDLARYLNPENGQLTLFFKKHLEPSFDDVGGEWKLKQQGGFVFSEEFVKYLNQSRRLRDAFFPNGGQQPVVNYEVTLDPVPDTNVLLEIDGGRVESSGAAPASAGFTFPAQGVGAKGVHVVVKSGEQTSEVSHTGEWGLFQFMKAAGAGAPSADNTYALALKVGPATVRAKLRPLSTADPFARSLYADYRAPRNVAQ